MRKPKPNLSVRVDADLVKEVRALGYSVTQLITEALTCVANTKRCPTCGKTTKL